jgi:hypothetical protein
MELAEALNRLDEAPKKISLSPQVQKKLAKVLLDISAVAKEGSISIKRGDSKTTTDAVKTIELGMKLINNLLGR